ncbi:MAG: hypothetical protein JO251_05795 [Verrucomicrobia bacterium]|nr:hypothetical protein [Verrucomicrobiota bacterium]
MRRIFDKSRCKCPRCVGKRRIQFLALFGSCIAVAAGCYFLVHHSEPGAPPTLNQQEALAEEPIPDVNVILGRKAQPLSIAATQLGAVWKEQDNKNAVDSPPKKGVSAGSREQSESLTLPERDRDLSENRSSKLVGEVPMSHATGWQTVVPSEVPKSPPKVDLQREPQPDGEKVAATAAQSSPEPPNSELLVQNQKSATTDPVSGAPAIAATPGTDSKSNASKPDKPEEDTGHSPEVAESELAGKQPEPPSGETSNVVTPSSIAQRITDPSFAGSAFAATVNVPPTPSNREVAAVGAADSREAGVNKNGVEAVKAAPSNPDGLLSQWLVESLRKPAETSLNGNELLAQNQEVAESEMPGKQPEPPSRKTSEVAAPSSVAQSIADPRFAGPAIVATTSVSPALSNGHVVGVGAAEPREKKNPENVALAKTSGPAAALVASLGNNTSGEVPALEPRKPRGYITIKSAPEEAQNQEAEDHPPKPRDHLLKTQNHPSNVEDYPSKALGHSEKPQDQPPNVRDYFSNTQDRPSKPPDTSGDLRRFASSFLQSDQTGNIADQHRFFADSVHYYHEGDLSWAGVAAATRRYHQERQNRRYGVEGAATVKGPVNGGFYVVEQPVSWSRSEGSRVTRGRSVLRLRVVPTDRNGWKITSIEEIGQQ